MKKLLLTCLIGFSVLGAFAQSVLITPGNQTIANSSPDLILRATFTPNIRGIRSGGTLDSPTAIATGSNLISLRGAGFYNTSIHSDQAAIDMLSTEAWSTTARGAEIRFSTTENGTNILTERLRIDHLGNLGIGTNNPRKKVHIKDGISGVVAVSPSNFMIEDDGSHYIQMAVPEAFDTGIIFGKPTNSASGGIIYDANNGLKLRTGGNLDRLRILSNGKVGIGSVPPGFPLHVTSTETSTSSTTGAFAIGETAGKHLVFDSDEINAYNNTAHSTLFLNPEGSGKVQVGTGTTGNLDVNGFSNLGDGAPAIKMKKLTGTMGPDQFFLIEHGLTVNKILAISIFVDLFEDGPEPPNSHFWSSVVERQYTYALDSTNITFRSGDDIQGKPYRILITYEE